MKNFGDTQMLRQRVFLAAVGIAVTIAAVAALRLLGFEGLVGPTVGAGLVSTVFAVWDKDGHIQDARAKTRIATESMLIPSKS